MLPEAAFDLALERLTPDLNPSGPLEELFAAKFARFTVLAEHAADSLMRINPHKETREYRRLAALLNSYERTARYALAELRRLQAERVLDAQETEPAKQPRLARVALFTKPDGAPSKHALLTLAPAALCPGPRERGAGAC